MASDLITGVKTSTGTKQIDFNALANLPNWDDITVGTAKQLTEDSVNSLISTISSNAGFARIQTGSYVGTGTYGASNPCSLTFIKIPHKKAVIFHG